MERPLLYLTCLQVKCHQSLIKTPLFYVCSLLFRLTFVCILCVKTLVLVLRYFVILFCLTFCLIRTTLVLVLIFRILLSVFSFLSIVFYIYWKRITSNTIYNYIYIYIYIQGGPKKKGHGQKINFLSHYSRYCFNTFPV